MLKNMRASFTEILTLMNINEMGVRPDSCHICYYTYNYFGGNSEDKIRRCNMNKVFILAGLAIFLLIAFIASAFSQIHWLHQKNSPLGNFPDGPWVDATPYVCLAHAIEITFANVTSNPLMPTSGTCPFWLRIK